MKKLNFNLLTVLLSVLMLTFVTSCKDDGDDPEPVSNTPVLNENFSFVVNGNNVVFTTTLTGSVWFTNVTAATDHNAVDGTVTVNIPLKGSYPFTCSALVDGQTYTSEEFTVEIENDDLSFLNDGIWKSLTGGPDGGKVWILDLEKKYFHAIADYYGDEDAGATGKDAWGPWGGGYVSSYDLGGEISFNGVEGTVSLKFNGETKNGNFTFETFDRPAAADYLNYGSGVTTYDLWNDGFVNGPYKYLSLSEQMGTMHLSEGLHFPLDSARFYNDAVKGSNTINPSQFLEDDLRNCDIVHLSDSAMVVRVKRTYEGDDESKCWMLYNFIVKGYEYPEEVFVAPDRPATAGALEDGTYKLAEIPGYYYNWITLALADTWTELDVYKKNMAEWWALGNPAETMTDGELNAEGQARWDAAYSAYTAQTIVVSGSNITVNYKGINVWGDTPTALIESSVETTFTSDGGVITFADPIKLYTPNAAFDNATELYILPDLFTTGIAIGHDDIKEDEKSYQTRLQNWIKQ